MMEDELIAIWQSSPVEEQVKFDKSRLMIDMKSSLRRFDRVLNFGILTEQIAGFIMIPVFTFYVYFVPFNLSKIASVLIVLWLIWYMLRLRKVKKLKPNSVNVTYLNYLFQTRTYLNTLKKMSDSAMYWYFLPIMLGVLLFIMGGVSEGALKGGKMIIMLSGLPVLGVTMYFYLKWVTKKLYHRRLKKLDELIATMEEKY